MIVRRSVLLVTVVLAGLSAGFFYSYESSVTLGLADVDDTTYVTTFQALNDTIRNPAFAVAFFGAIPALVAALVLHWNAHPARRLLIGLALACYVICLAITGTGNVPLNNELAEVTSITELAAADARSDFEADWNRLNLYRTIAVVISFVLVAAAAGIVETANSSEQPPG